MVGHQIQAPALAFAPLPLRCASHTLDTVALYITKRIGIFIFPRFWNFALGPKKLARRQRNTPACQGWSRTARWRGNWQLRLSLLEASIRFRAGRSKRCLSRSNNFRAGIKTSRTAHLKRPTVSSVGKGQPFAKGREPGNPVVAVFEYQLQRTSALCGQATLAPRDGPRGVRVRPPFRRESGSERATQYSSGKTVDGGADEDLKSSDGAHRNRDRNRSFCPRLSRFPMPAATQTAQLGCPVSYVSAALRRPGRAMTV